MTIFLAPTVKLNRGKPRIWLEGQRLARGEFTPDTRYNLSFSGGEVVLTACKDGRRKVSAYKTKPIIDLCSNEVGEWFPVGTKLEAIVRRGRIVIRRLANTLKALKRDRDLLDKLRKGEPLNVVSMFHGAGILSRSLSDGFAMAGVSTRTMLAAEIDGRYLDASLRANPGLFDSESVLVNAPVQDVEFNKVQSANIMEIGLPCTGMSKSGRSRLKLSSAEEHPQAGALFFTSLEWIKAFQPAVAIIECTPELLTSPSISVIRSVLLGWKYDLFELCLNGCEYGALENRDRAVVIAMSSDLATAGAFDANDIRPVRTKEAKLADILEDIPEDDSRWAIHTYLEEKMERDKKAGKGFMRQIFTGAEALISTITRGYAKIRSTDPHIAHPTKARYTRLLTPKEHARAKALPEGWIDACELPDTVAHEALGQGCVYSKFKAVGAAIGYNFKTLSEKWRPMAEELIPATAVQLELAVAA